MTAHDKPHDRLSKIADAIGNVLAGVPDVRCVILMEDADGGCAHPVGYREGDTGLLFTDVAAQLMSMADALGVDLGITLNGEVILPG